MGWKTTGAPTGTYYYLGGHGISASDLYACGVKQDSSRAAVLHYDGAAWAALDPGADLDAKRLNACYAIAADNVYFVGGNVSGDRAGGVIVHYDGETFTAITPPSADELFAVWAFAANDIWVGGANVALHHWNGSAWSQIDMSDFSGDIHAFWGSAANALWIGADNGGYFWNGSAIDPDIAISAPFNVLALAGSAANDVYAVGVGGTASFLAHWDGETWSNTQTFFNVSDALFGLCVPPGTVYPWAVGSFPWWAYFNNTFNTLAGRPVTEDAVFESSWLGGTAIFAFGENDIWCVGPEQVYHLESAPGTVAAPVAPEVINVSPAPGSPLTGLQPWRADVHLDPGDGTIVRLVVFVQYQSLATVEVAYDSQRFTPEFNGRSTIGAYGDGGYSLSIIRNGGWPDAPKFFVHAVSDNGGVNA
jgi:hypothetical protein